MQQQFQHAPTQAAVSLARRFIEVLIPRECIQRAIRESKAHAPQHALHQQLRSGLRLALRIVPQSRLEVRAPETTMASIGAERAGARALCFHGWHAEYTPVV